MHTSKLLRTASIATIALLGLTHIPAYSDNIISNGSFDNDNYYPWEPPGWWSGGDGTYGVDEEGRFCTTVTALGTANWGAQLRQNSLTYVAGEPYTVTLNAWASAESTLEMAAIDESDGFTWIFGQHITVNAPLDGEPQTFSFSYTAAADATAGKFRFSLGAGAVPLNETICFDNIVVDGPEGGGNEVAEPASPVHVSQLGYVPNALKLATYALPSESIDSGSTYITTPRTWSLMQGDTVVDHGETILHSAAIDAASGDLVHRIDFSDYNTPGDMFTLVVAEGDTTFTSEPFTIGSDIYTPVKYDALAYFYHNRSGTPILADVVGDAWSRPAGHESDTQVQTLICATDPLDEECITLDVVGGWYDAGDHGKYVVNGGISAWTMLNQYERFKNMSSVAAFSDGNLILPTAEGTNNVNDLLDEARWQVEWLLKMQVPNGQPLAGMAYHKMHDENWTGLPTAPHEDTQVRYVHPPSTAATLNLAAVGAQCYRMYKTIDMLFAQACLDKALTAYEAAKNNPELYAIRMESSSGGGPYNDSNVTDEFHWAATELYLATGLPYFADEMSNSPLHFNPIFAGVGLLSWQDTDSLGLISLAIANRDTSKASTLWIKAAQTELTKIANRFVASSMSEGYGLPMSSDSYPWGSNSAVLNNMLVLGLAYDFTGDDQYINAMIQGADYIFGRNPLGHSYVTGYGTRAEKYPHHRFWAEILSANYPPAPAGAVSGGPNNGLQDPIAAGLLTGCAPQRCFVDDIQAWSVNEITINWNAPFAWVMAYLDEYATHINKRFYLPASLIATDTLTIANRSSVSTRPIGNVYAGELVLGTDAHVLGHVFVQGGATLNSRAGIEGNLTLNGNITTQDDTLVEHINADANISMPVIPQFAVAIGEADIMVGNDQYLALAPGSYGDIVVSARGELVLTDGEYHMNTLTVETDGKIAVDASNDTAILVEHNIQLGDAATITVEEDTSLTLYSNTSHVVSIGSGMNLSGNIIVPNGDVSIYSNSSAHKIAAKNIRIEPDTQLNTTR